MAIRCNTPKIRTPCSGLLLFTHSLNCRAPSDQWTNGNQFKPNPIKKINIVRLITFFQNIASPASCNLGITNDIAFPTANRKKGKTKSVGVQPCHGACFNGANICDQVPGLLTKIIKATVAPLKTSNE